MKIKKKKTNFVGFVKSRFHRNGLLGMYRRMGSHFHDSTYYNGAAFSRIFNTVVRMGSHF